MINMIKRYKSIKINLLLNKKILTENFNLDKLKEIVDKQVQLQDWLGLKQVDRYY